MTVITANTSRAFVTGARLPPPPSGVRGKRDLAGAAPIELKDTDAQALVVGSSLVVAAKDVPAETRADIVNCTLFAQLAASGSVSDASNVLAWYQVYFNSLTAIGWAQSDSRFEKFDSTGTNIEAHKSIIAVLSAMLGPAAAAVTLVTTTLEALQSMNENSPWITLFNRETTTSKSAHFQVATAQPGKGGLLEIALVAFALESKIELTQVLFFKFKTSSIKLNYARGNATIYEAVLSQSRQQIANRLAAYRSAYIGEVRFPPPPTVANRGVAPPASRNRKRGISARPA